MVGGELLIETVIGHAKKGHVKHKYYYAIIHILFGIRIDSIGRTFSEFTRFICAADIPNALVHRNNGPVVIWRRSWLLAAFRIIICHSLVHGDLVRAGARCIWTVY